MNKLLWSFCMSMLLSSAVVCADNPQPYTTIQALPYIPSYLPNSWVVLSEFTNVNGTVFVDVNSQDGAAARYMAGNVPEGSTVYNISSWDTLDSYQQFLSNVIQENNTTIVPVRMTSAEASSGLNIKADIVYLNTSDPTQLQNDIALWVSHLTLSGKICGDNWGLPLVELTVVQSAVDLGLNLYINGSFWALSQ